MFLREAFLSICILLPAIGGIQIDDECFSRSNHEVILYDEYTHLTAWVGQNRSLPILKIQVEFVGREFHDFDEVIIMDDVIRLKRVRKGEETKESKISCNERIEDGWLEVDFFSGKHYKLNIGLNGNYSFEEENHEVIEKLEVEGHFSTVNCQNRNVIWMIQSDASMIPLMHLKTNIFTLYSKTPFMPILMFGNDELTLGWRDNRVDDVTMYNKKFKEELPGLKEIEITVYCDTSCNVQLQNGERLSKELSSEMKIIRLEDQVFFLILQLPYIKQTLYITETVSETPMGFTELTVAVIVLIIIIIIIIIMGIIIFVWIWKAKKKMKSNKHGFDELDQRNHLMETDQVSGKSIQSNVEKHNSDYLWDAVVDEDIELIKELLKDQANPIKKIPGKSTTPEQEAHIRGYIKIVDLFNEHLGLKKQYPSEDLIAICMNVFVIREKEIFTAAKYGNYERTTGVKYLLRNHGIPGTILDSNGWSILHYMAKKSYEDGRPVWAAVDIRSFLTENTHLINAVDFWGNTPLHIIANHKSRSDNKIVWDSQEYTSDEAWVELAKILFDFGCKPDIVNHQNQNPYQIANSENINNTKIAAYLKKILDEVQESDYEKLSMEQENLIKESENGNIEKMLPLLKKGVPLLSVSSKKNMLNAAIRKGEKDAIFILLCAGMPLCNITTEYFTSLQVAHHTKGLPALFPLILRKVYADRITTEMVKLDLKDEIYNKLHAGMKSLKEQILSKGDKCKWEFKAQNQKDINSEARELLLGASKLGLSLTIQLLGIQSVDLRPLPGENSPIEVVVDNKHFDTLIVLTRDLKMPPYAYPKKFDNMLDKLGCALWFCERKILREKALEQENKLSLELTEGKVDDYIQQLRSLKENNTKVCGKWDNHFLYLLAKYGLVYILHLIKRKCEDLSLDQVVQSFSKSTMLHISVYFKQLHMTEYLLNHGANPDLLAIGGFTVLHTAAWSGHKEHFDFILNFMKHKNNDIQMKCNLGLTAEKLMTLQLKLNSKREKHLYPPLSNKDAAQVLSVSNKDEFVFNLLEKRGEVLGFKNMDDIIDKAEIMLKRNLVNESGEIFIEETKHLFDLPKEDTIMDYGPCFEGGDVLFENYAKLFIESKKFSAYGPNVNVKWRLHNDVNKMSKCIQLSEISSLLNSDEKVIDCAKFLKDFCITARSQIENYKSDNDEISLCPPYAVPYHKGIKIFWASCKGENLKHYRIYVEPVIKSLFPSNIETKALPDYMKKIKERCDWVYIHLVRNPESWTYRAVLFERDLFKDLKDNQRKVWISCKIIKLLTEKYWWTQNLYENDFLNPWRSERNYAKLLPESALKSMFMEELLKMNKHNWERDDIPQRIVSIFKSAIQTKESRHNINAFLLPNYFLFCDPYVVLSIIRYLKNRPNSIVQFDEIEKKV